MVAPLLPEGDSLHNTTRQRKYRWQWSTENKQFAEIFPMFNRPDIAGAVIVIVIETTL